ncbi:MAG: NUDIX domain-containing protein [Vicinamibacterales bacterium]
MSDPRGREHPSHPVIAVGAVVLTIEDEVVLVKRRHPPLAGRWSLPGGVLELGETLEQGVMREVVEETGLRVAVGPLVDVAEHIELDATGVAYHYVVVDYACQRVGGTLVAGEDAEAVALAALDELEGYMLTDATLAVIRAARSLRRP